MAQDVIFKGSIVALVTPMNKQGDIDELALRDLVDSVDFYDGVVRFLT